MRCFAYAIVYALLAYTFATTASVTWTVSKGALLRNGVQVSLKGVSVTCLEYLLQGIGTACLARYNFANTSSVITTLEQDEMDAIYKIILPSPNPNVQPAIRLQINAGYFLDVPTPNWSVNRGKFPNLSTQYRQLIDAAIQDATKRGIVVIIDLHWNDDVNQFSQMALVGTTTTGDSSTFWSLIAQKYASNPYVFYDLFNAPHINSFNSYMEGDTTFSGMRTMTAVVLQQNVKGLIIVSGQISFAYDDNSLIQYAQQINSLTKVLFAFQPFMGPQVGNDLTKTVPGFIERVDRVFNVTGRPIVLTSLGQFCCPNDGPCNLHDGTHLGFNMGYVKAILFESTKRNISWFAFGYRPGLGGDCTQPDINDVRNLYQSNLHGGNGADWNSLFSIFYPGNFQLATARPNTAPQEQPKSIAGPVGGGIGGVIAAVGIMGMFWAHRKKHLENQKRLDAEIAQWTDSEVRALKEKWQRTHDFEELCSVVPHRSRESVAYKAKSFQQKSKSVFFNSFSPMGSAYVPSERFAFIYPRMPYNIPRPSFRPPTREGTFQSSFEVSPMASSTKRLQSDALGPFASARHPNPQPRMPASPQRNKPKYYMSPLPPTKNPSMAMGALSHESSNPMYYNSVRTTATTVSY